MKEPKFTKGTWIIQPEGIYSETGVRICSLPDNEVDRMVVSESSRMLGMLQALNHYNPVFRAKIHAPETMAGRRQQNAIRAEDASRFLVQKILNF